MENKITKLTKNEYIQKQKECKILREQKLKMKTLDKEHKKLQKELYEEVFKECDRKIKLALEQIEEMKKQISEGNLTISELVEINNNIVVV